jgi:hypothetical protein
VGPEHEVLLYDEPAYKKVVPPEVHVDDIHVASAALVLLTLAQEEGVADKVFIVSSNLKHLAGKEMAAIGIRVISPSRFIDKLNAAASGRVEIALMKTVNELKAPPYTQEDMLMLLATHGARETEKFYAHHWKVELR